MNEININNLTSEQKSELLRQLSDEKANAQRRKKDAYESIKEKFLIDVKARLMRHVQDCRDFKEWLRGEAEAYMKVLHEYGQLKRDDQLGFSIKNDDFKVQMKGNRVKGFDERADVAERRLVNFLNAWIEKTENGKNNPMYKLAMGMIQRNEAGDLDYKSISQLYELEADFDDPEYSEIMSLFKESHCVEGTVIQFYFEKKDNYNRWTKVEPSFNKM
ncbi:MAG: DUF3164 domain-containing protein [Prevotella sp.]